MHVFENGIFTPRHSLKNNEKTRQNAENKQTFGLNRKNEVERKNSSKCRKQSFDFMGKLEIEGKTRQNAENKQTFNLMP